MRCASILIGGRVQARGRQVLPERLQRLLLLRGKVPEVAG